MSTVHILVIEDDHALAASLEDLLEMHDFEVTTVLTGKEGLAALEKNIPQLILLDIRLPDMTGYDFLAHLKRTAHGAIPVLVLTASERTHEIAKNSGIAPEYIFFKPETKISDLMHAIQSRLTA